MIIDNTKPEFEDMPDTLNGEVFLDRPAAGGFITIGQEDAYYFSIATPEQAAYFGHDIYDYSTLDKVVCRKPALEKVAINAARISQELIDNLTIPEPAKAGLQNRIDGLLVAMQAISFDDGLRLALQLPIDIEA